MSNHMQYTNFPNVTVDPLMNALSNNLLSSISTNKQVVVDNPYLFNHEVDPVLPITNQKSSGRCWLFATMNLIRLVAYNNFVKSYNLKIDNLEFSQAYVFFWDKFHRYQQNLEYYIQMLEEAKSDEYLRTFFNDPMGDGGQWDMAKAVVEKYGVVPKEVYPDSTHASNSKGLNHILTMQLKNDCLELKNLSPESRVDMKRTMVKRVYKMLVSLLGEPPKPDKNFKWTFTAKSEGKQKVITWSNETPLSLLKKTSFNPNEWVSVVNDPRPNNPYGYMYKIKYLGNLEEKGVGWLNLPVSRLKELTAQAIKDNVPVWFGCDVGNNWDRSSGVHHPGIQNFKGTVGLNFNLNKAQRLETFSSLPNHAMVITGLFEEDNTVKRWKIENSWGTKSGNKGNLLMTDEWFSEYVFQIVVNRKYLNEKELVAEDGEHRTVEPWDPLGTLA